MAQDPVIFWFRQDLRLEDNPALRAAAKTGRPLVAIYILDEGTAGAWPMGGASRWWLHRSLAALRDDLQGRGVGLVLRRGDGAEILPALATELGARGVYFTRAYEPAAAAKENSVAEKLSESGVEAHRFGGALLFEPDAITTKAGEPFKVFTPFYKACLAETVPQPVRGVPELHPCDARPGGDSLEDWGLLPTAPDWSGGLRESWTPGEAGAKDRLETFLMDALETYPEGRDRPGDQATSRLSPHLHFGEISPRALWHRVDMQAKAREPSLAGAASAYLRELVWREFSYHLLFHFPDLPEAPFRPQFADFPWLNDRDALAAWQRGRTGYPLVDAGMRELWHRGWMHNRVRMVTASFLVKHLLIPWQEGERWFWDTLVDADLANNAASWQWVAGCGADAAPYFRIFNPVLQGQKFDPDGRYVRDWVPELAALPDKFIHCPWEAPADLLRENGIRLGHDYPEPIVEHAFARARALEKLNEIR
ncbi:MAG: deoxyribodipyrimidine photo-lyase [Alphaproteobacteria bacterium]|nr:deoxyribodipyrimidine photo-lyase [Alphaproteobacteria bacterium]